MNRRRTKYLFSVADPPPRRSRLPIFLISLVVIPITALALFPHQLDNAIHFWQNNHQEFFATAYDWWDKELRVESGELREKKQRNPKPPTPEEMAELVKLERKEKDYKSPEGRSDEERLAKIREKFRAQYALAQETFGKLKTNVAGAIKKDDFATAEDMITTFTKSGHYIEGLMKWDVDKLKDTIRLARNEWERKLRDEGELAFKEALNTSETLLAEDRFDDAIATLKPFQSYPLDTIKQKTAQRIAEIERIKSQFDTTTIPTRRDTYLQLYLQLRPHLARRDYTSAIALLQKINTSPLRKGALDKELGSMKMVDDLFPIVEKNISQIEEKSPLALTDKNGTQAKGKFGGVKNGVVSIILEDGGSMEIPVRELSAKDVLKYADVERNNSSLPASVYFLFYDGAFELLREEIGLVFAKYNVSAMDTFAEILELADRSLLVENILIKNDVDVAIGEAQKLYDAKKFDQAIALLNKVKQRYEGNDTYKSLSAELDKLFNEITAKAISPVVSEKVAILNKKDATIDEKVKVLDALKVLQDRHAVPYIAKMLSDESATVRMKAVEVLASYKDDRILVEVIMALDDPVYEIGASAAEQLLRANDPRGIALKLMERLEKSTDEKERRLSAIGLGVLGKEPVTVSRLVSALRDESPSVREAVATALVRIGDKSVGSSIISALQDEKSPEVKVALVRALGSMKIKGASREILKLLKEEPSARYLIDYIRAVGDTGEKSDLEKLLPYLKNEGKWVRNTVLEALRKSEVKVDEDDLRSVLSDEFDLNRVTGLELFGIAGRDGSLKRIIDALADKSELVRETAGQVLTNWKDREVVKSLINGMEKLNSDGQGLAVKVLTALTGEKFDTAPQWREWLKKNWTNYRLPR